MRKTITGTGGMLLLQTLKDAGVEYLFTNPGSAETGIFAAHRRGRRPEAGRRQARGAGGRDGRRLPPHQRQGRRRHRARDGRLVPARRPALQRAGGRLVAAGHRGRLGVRAAGLPRPRAVSRPDARPSRCARSPRKRAAPIRCTRIPRPSPWRPSARCARPPRRRPGPVYLSISAELLNREGLEAQIGEDAQLPDRAAGPGARADGRGDRAPARRGAVPGADVRRRRLARGRAGRGGAAGRAARGAGVREPADLPELPDAPSALLRQLSGLQGLREGHRAQAGPDLPGRLPGRARQRERAVS